MFVWSIKKFVLEGHSGGEIPGQGMGRKIFVLLLRIRRVLKTKGKQPVQKIQGGGWVVTRMGSQGIQGPL